MFGVFETPPDLNVFTQSKLIIMKQQFIKLQEFCIDTQVTAVNPIVRVNSNGYLFITFLRDEEAENIYLSKKLNEVYTEKQDIRSELRNMFITHSVNAEGELRTKLCERGESEYVDVSELFG